jgi:hypothetical protein
VGVQSLLVSGELVVDGGKLILDAAPGRPIRRTAQAREKEKMMMAMVQRHGKAFNKCPFFKKRSPVSQSTKTKLRYGGGYYINRCKPII